MVEKTSANTATKTSASIKPVRHSSRATTTGNPTEVTGETLRFDLLQSALYHDRMQMKLARTGRFLVFANILLGSAVVAAFGAQFPLVGQISGVAIAVLGAVSLVWDQSGQARDHASLRRSFYGLLQDFEEGADLMQVQGRMTRLFADEPPFNESVRDVAHDMAGKSLYGAGNFKLAKDKNK